VFVDEVVLLHIQTYHGQQVVSLDFGLGFVLADQAEYFVLLQLAALVGNHLGADPPLVEVEHQLVEFAERGGHVVLVDDGQVVVAQGLQLVLRGHFALVYHFHVDGLLLHEHQSQVLDLSGQVEVIESLVDDYAVLEVFVQRRIVFFGFTDFVFEFQVHDFGLFIAQFVEHIVHLLIDFLGFSCIRQDVVLALFKVF